MDIPIKGALGGAYIYGERDFLIWDSAMTEGNNDAHDVFIRHSLMNGERVPVIMIGGQGANSHSNVRKALQDATGGFWHGDFHEPDGFIHLSDDVEDLNVLPYPSRGLKCEVQWDNCKIDRFASSCWIDRKDVEPSMKQSNKVPSQVNWHPGW